MKILDNFSRHESRRGGENLEGVKLGGGKEEIRNELLSKYIINMYKIS
jgi:hypothetical protein